MRLWRRARLWAVAVALALAAAGCDSGGTSPLPPYEGGRPLDLLKVTQSFTPEIQWVGGRVAAVGVNRGTRPALDSTLVWLRMASDDSIGSFATVGLESSLGAVEGYGGTFQNRLADGETYTVWIAERAALDAGLDSTQRAAGTFADTTLTMRLVLRGQNEPTQPDVTFVIERDERLTGDRLLVRWTPADLRFRRMAIREGTVGGFTNLIWDFRTPEGQPSLIASPVTIGVTPEGAEELLPFRETGFEPDVIYNNPNDPINDPDNANASTYFLWAGTDAWNETFVPSAPGYAWFRITGCNFDIDDPCPPIPSP